MGYFAGLQRQHLEPIPGVEGFSLPKSHDQDPNGEPSIPCFLQDLKALAGHLMVANRCENEGSGFLDLNVYPKGF